MSRMLFEGACVLAITAAGVGVIAGYRHYQQFEIDQRVATEKQERANDNLRAVIGALKDKVGQQTALIENYKGQINEIEQLVGGYNQLSDTYDKMIALSREIAELRGALEAASQKDTTPPPHSQTHPQNVPVRVPPAQKPKEPNDSRIINEMPDVRGAVASLFTQAKFPESVKAAFMHRINQESGFDPQSVSSSGKYHCLVQWDRERYHDLLTFANHKPTKGTPCPPVAQQISFITHELQSRYQHVWQRAAQAGHNAYYIITAGYFGGAQ